MAGKEVYFFYENLAYPLYELKRELSYEQLPSLSFPYFKKGKKIILHLPIGKKYRNSKLGKRTVESDEEEILVFNAPTKKRTFILVAPDEEEILDFIKKIIEPIATSEELFSAPEKFVKIVEEILEKYQKEKLLEFGVSIEKLKELSRRVAKVVKRGELLSLEDIKNISRVILQTDYLPGQEKYLRKLEKALNVDIKRKKQRIRYLALPREITEAETLGIETPSLKQRLKICLRTLIHYQYLMEQEKLFEEFDKGNIDFDSCLKKSIKVHNELYSLLK